MEVEDFRKFHGRDHAASYSRRVLTVDGRHVVLSDGDDLDDRFQRHGDDISVDFDHQAGKNGQGQRQFDGQRGALSRFTIQVDGAVEVFDLRLHDVHTHPAPGYLRDFLGRTQARFPDHLEHLVAGHRVEFGFAIEILFEGFGSDFFRVEPFPIVGYLDHDAISAMERIQGDRPFGRLPGGDAVLG